MLANPESISCLKDRADSGFVAPRRPGVTEQIFAIAYLQASRARSSAAEMPDSETT
jgi:hypothetical protein